MVEAVGVGRRRAQDVALRVEQVNRHARDARLAFIAVAVAVDVGIHIAGEAAGRNEFAEVVVHRVDVRGEHRAGDAIAGLRQRRRRPTLPT